MTKREIDNILESIISEDGHHAGLAWITQLGGNLCIEYENMIFTPGCGYIDSNGNDIQKLYLYVVDLYWGLCEKTNNHSA